MSKSGIKEKEKTIPEMLKTFFRRNPKATPSSNPYMQYEEFVLTPELMKEISPDSPLNQRLRIFRELNDTVLSKRLEDHAIEALWQASSDLFQSSMPKDCRHVMLTFLKNLIQGQYEKLGITRAQFFSFIQQHNNPDDFNLRFDILKALTVNGKDVLYFEEEMGPFLLDWMSEVLNSSKANEFLILLENVVKFNSACLDQEVLESLISNTCVYACCTNMEENITKCLSLLDVFVCYSCLPPESLSSLIFTLCRTVNVEKFCQISWKLMKNLLGTHLGHTAVSTLCSILQDRKNAEDFSLLRGAVFFLSMGLWGPTRVSSLQHPPHSVLPSYLQCLQHKDANVAIEVGLAIQRLVQRNGTDLYLMTWDLVMDILDELFRLSEEIKLPLLASIVTETLTTIEELYEGSHFGGDVERLFLILEKCAAKLPESSILQLINYKAQAISPMKALWLTNLNYLVDKFFRLEKRTKIRVKALEILASIIESNKQVYEEDMIDKIVLPLLKNIENDPDMVVSNVAVQLLVTVARDCTSKRCLDILEIIQKVINKPLEQTTKVEDALNILHENELCPMYTAANGLVQIFKVKLFQLPSSHAVQAFQILTSHIHAHYNDPVIIHTNAIRLEVLKCFLQLRCSGLNQIGIIDDEGKTTTFSPYLLCATSDRNSLGTASPPVSSPTPFAKTVCTVTYLSPVKSFQAIITALKKDIDWEVLKVCLDHLPNLLQNQTLILSGENVVGNLCSTLCAMLGDRNLGLPETLRNVPPNFSRADFHSHVLPVLAALVSYHKHLDNSLQRRLVKCLEFGFVTKCARVCITALTLCILEMRDTMYKLLPEVLLSLSKISATVGISIPILEFLSSLIRLPKLYASFVEDQYMSIFAISLPYINPFKFNHYTVALAYHVIAMWFLKCRLPFRRDFVKFIIQGLQSNVLIPLEEGENRGMLHINLEDSSSRRRASSMNEQALAARKRERGSIVSGNITPAMEPRHVFNQQMKDLNLELTETCIDLMARYTFAACSALPKRFPASKFLLAGGQSMTWLLGTKLITVTTSGCSSKILRQGLCDKCFSMCKGEKGKLEETSRELSESNPLRRRHRSAIQRSVTTEIHNAQPRTKDDLQLQKSSYAELRSSDSSTSPLIMQSKSEINSKNIGLESNMGSQEFETQNLDKLIFALQDSTSPSPSNSNSHTHLCNCWCQGWAEILVRRPTGNVSWMMRVQNQPHLFVSVSDFPLVDITTLLLPTHQDSEGAGVDAYKLIANHRRIDSESLEETEYEKIFQEHFDLGQSTEFSKDSEKELEKNLTPTKTELAEHRKSTTAALLKSTPLAKLIEGKPVLRKTSSSPDLFDSCNKGADEIRKERVHSDTGAVSKLAKTRLERRAMLKSGDASSINYRGKETLDCDINLMKLMLKKPEKESEKVTEQRILPSNMKNSDAIHLSQDVSADVHNASSAESEGTPNFKKSPRSEVEKPLQTALRQHSAPQEELDDSTSENVSTRLMRRGSERAVHFDLKTKSPPHSPRLPKHESSFRDRGHTISTANPAYRNRSRENDQKGNKDLHRSGINPSFVFLQLYQDSCFGNKNEIPLLLPKNEMYERSLKCFDRIPPYETHKIGIVYIGKGQVNNEAAILGNSYGSSRYVEFLKGLGHLICLKEISPETTYIGGLGQNGEDGKFAYIWQDDVMQVIFHVATLMPFKKSDPNGVSKKLHIGNDYVTIVYNDSGEEFNIQTIKGQFMYACVVIHPLDHDSNLVIVKTKPDLEGLIGHSSPKIISNPNLPILARQLALHANLASMIFQSQKSSSSCNPYASNWLERLRDLKRMRKKLLEELEQKGKEGMSAEQLNIINQQSKYNNIKDFTDYV